jgi:hypothetical protein
MGEKRRSIRLTEKPVAHLLFCKVATSRCRKLDVMRSVISSPEGQVLRDGGGRRERGRRVILSCEETVCKQ